MLLYSRATLWLLALTAMMAWAKAGWVSAQEDNSTSPAAVDAEVAVTDFEEAEAETADINNDDEEDNETATGNLDQQEIAKIAGNMDCTSGLREFDPLVHKKIYTVGVHAPGGVENAWQFFNYTFQDYLTATAGQRFDPPIEFQMTVSVDPLADWVDGDEIVDFMYTDTGLYSCIGVEIGAQPVATTVAHMEVRGHLFDVDMFAGTY